MQKIMICLERPLDNPISQFKMAIEHVLTQFQSEFSAIRFALIDDDVVLAKSLEIIQTNHPKDAVISVWRNNGFKLDAFYQTLETISTQQKIYTVLESTPLVYPTSIGRVPGMCQLAFLSKPETLTRDEWLTIWLGSHTTIAIETQSTFSYRQNIAVINTAANNTNAVYYDAIVEENFPAAAMNDRAVFFAAEGDFDKYKANEKRMIESCMRFIDFNKFDCVPMSEYVLK